MCVWALSAAPSRAQTGLVSLPSVADRRLIFISQDFCLICFSPFGLFS